MGKATANIYFQKLVIRGHLNVQMGEGDVYELYNNPVVRYANNTE